MIKVQHNLTQHTKHTKYKLKLSRENKLPQLYERLKLSIPRNYRQLYRYYNVICGHLFLKKNKSQTSDLIFNPAKGQTLGVVLY